MKVAGGNQAAAQDSQDGNNDSETGISQSSSSSHKVLNAFSEGNTEASCNNVSIQANQNGNSDDEDAQHQ